VKEEGRAMNLFVVDDTKCNHCGLCVLQCPRSVIEMPERKSPPSLADGGEERCVSCGHCVSICAPAALSHKSMSPEDLPPVRKEGIPHPKSVELLLRSRRSVRVFKKKKVPRATLERILSVARYAPSGSNSQMV